MLAEGIDFVLRLVSIVVLGRLLLPEDFGLVAMVTAFTAIAYGFRDLGLAMVTIQRKDITDAQVSTLFWLNTALGAALTLVTIGLAFPVASFYKEPRLIPIGLVVASSFLWTGLSVQHQALLRRRMRFGPLAAIQIGSSALSVALAIWMAIVGYGYWALVARDVSRLAFAAAGAWFFMPWRPSAPSRHKELTSMVKFGADLTAFNLLWYWSANFDQILIGKLFGPGPLGYYRQGINLVLHPMTQLMGPFNTVAESALSRLQTDAAQYRNYYMRILSLLSIITMPLAVLLAVFADEVVAVVLGPQWQPAGEFFTILAVASVLKPATSTVGFVMITCGKSRRFFWWGVVNSMALVCLIAICSVWGTTGIAWAQVAATYLVFVPTVYWAFRGTPIRPRDFGSSVVKPLLASVLTGIVLSVLKDAAPLGAPLVSLLIGTAFGGLLYLAILLSVPGGMLEVKRAIGYVKTMIRSSG